MGLAGAAAGYAVPGFSQGRVFTLGLCWVEPNPWRQTLLEALRSLGYVEGQNLRIADRTVKDGYGQIDENARALVAVRPDVIVGFGGTAPDALAKLTNDIPIVAITANDFVDTGLAKSLSRPGRNVTGFGTSSSVLYAKRVELLKEFVPGMMRLGLIVVPESFSYARFLRSNEAAARTLGVATDVAEVHRLDDLKSAFESLAKARVDAFLMTSASLLNGQSKLIVPLAAQYRLPAVYHAEDFVRSEGLASYGASVKDSFVRSASYIDRILRGTPPGDLPIQEPTVFDLRINLKTAKTLGLTIPPSILARADEVIE